MKVRAVRIRTFVFSWLPIKNSGHNFAVVDNVFNSLIPSLGAFSNLLHKRVSCLGMVIKVGIDIYCPDYAIAGDMIRIRAISKMTSISDPAIAAPIPRRKFIVYLLS